MRSKRRRVTENGETESADAASGAQNGKYFPADQDAFRLSAPFQLLARAGAEIEPGLSAADFVERLSSSRLSSNFPRN